MTKEELKKAFDVVNQDMIDDKVMMNSVMEIAQKVVTPDGKCVPTEQLIAVLFDSMLKYHKAYTYRILEKLLVKS